MAPRHIPMLAYNWITGVGAMLASVTLLTGAFFLSVSAVSGLPSPYVGIFIYLVLPAMTLVGICLLYTSPSPRD